MASAKEVGRPSGRGIPIREGGRTPPGPNDTVPAAINPRARGLPSREVRPLPRGAQPAALAPDEVVISAEDAESLLEPLIREYIRTGKVGKSSVAEYLLPMLEHLRPEMASEGGEGEPVGRSSGRLPGQRSEGRPTGMMEGVGRPLGRRAGFDQGGRVLLYHGQPVSREEFEQHEHTGNIAFDWQDVLPNMDTVRRAIAPPPGQWNRLSPASEALQNAVRPHPIDPNAAWHVPNIGFPNYPLPPGYCKGGKVRGFEEGGEVREPGNVSGGLLGKLQAWAWRNNPANAILERKLHLQEIQRGLPNANAPNPPNRVPANANQQPAGTRGYQGGGLVGDDELERLRANIETPRPAASTQWEMPGGLKGPGTALVPARSAQPQSLVPIESPPDVSIPPNFERIDPQAFRAEQARRAAAWANMPNEGMGGNAPTMGPPAEMPMPQAPFRPTMRPGMGSAFRIGGLGAAVFRPTMRPGMGSAFRIGGLGAAVLPDILEQTSIYAGGPPQTRRSAQKLAELHKEGFLNPAQTEQLATTAPPQAVGDIYNQFRYGTTMPSPQVQDVAALRGSLAALGMAEPVPWAARPPATGLPIQPSTALRPTPDTVAQTTVNPPNPPIAPMGQTAGLGLPTTSKTAATPNPLPIGRAAAPGSWADYFAKGGKPIPIWQGSDVTYTTTPEALAAMKAAGIDTAPYLQANEQYRQNRMYADMLANPKIASAIGNYAGNPPPIRQPMEMNPLYVAELGLKEQQTETARMANAMRRPAIEYEQELWNAAANNPQQRQRLAAGLLGLTKQEEPILTDYEVMDEKTGMPVKKKAQLGPDGRWYELSPVTGGMGLPMSSGGATQGKQILQPGTVMDGYRFRGGDPSSPASWERL